MDDTQLEILEHGPIAKFIMRPDDPCWLCLSNFKKLPSVGKPEGVHYLYSTYIDNREQISVDRMGTLLASLYHDHIWEPANSRGETNLHILTPSEVVLHLKFHSMDPIQVLLNMLHDLRIQEEVLSNNIYVQHGDVVVVNGKASDQLHKVRKQIIDLLKQISNK